MQLKIFYIFLFILIINDSESIANNNNNKFIKRFAQVKYNKTHLQANHRRVQRSLVDQISLDFEAFERQFNLVIKPSDKNFFENKDTIEFNDNKNYKLEEKLTNYEGIVKNDEKKSSYVFGTIINGVFLGTIEIENAGRYYIEPAKRFDLTQANNKTTTSENYHSIIYHENDIDLDTDLKEAKKRINKMLKESGAADHFYVDDEKNDDLLNCALNDKKIKEKIEVEQSDSFKSIHDKEDLMFKYTREANENKQHSRAKRQTATTGQQPFPNSLNTCNLYLIADPFYYNTIFTNEGQKSATLTLTYIRNNFNTYVAKLNQVYSQIKFYTDSTNTNYYTGINFVVSNIKVITFDQCNSPTSTLTTAEQNLCLSNLDVFTYLGYTALQNYDKYCLAYTFTARDFANGALGLAYTANITGTGGICEKNTQVGDAAKSLNTGTVTILNYGKRVAADILVQIAFLHEIGHSFGSGHDETTQCAPGASKGGNYIMYYRAVPGTQSNNVLYSSCSLAAFGQLLNYVVQNKFCFISSSNPTCGNGIVDSGEQCDCGSATDCTDKCCNPSTCQLTTGATCSPSLGACCESDCTYSSTTKICSTASECSQAATCSGTTAKCSSASNQPDLTPCNGGTQVCLGGVCNGSACQAVGMTQCYLTGDLSDPTVDKFNLCHLACQGANGVCMDSFSNSSAIYAKYSTGISLKPGSTCNNDTGYCDALSKCRTVNLNVVAQKLLSSLLNPKGVISDIKTWVQTNWWAVLIFVIIFLAAFNLIIYLLAKCLPTSNPNKNIIDVQNKLNKNGNKKTSLPSTSGVRRRSQIFTTEISDNVDYDRPVLKKAKKNKQRILV